MTEVVHYSMAEDTPAAAERLRAINARLESLPEYRGSTLAKVGRGRNISIRLRLSNAAMLTFFKPSLMHTVQEAKRMLGYKDAKVS